MNVVFSETLRRLREEKGFSQKQLGKQMFVNHSTIARWENGSRLPDAEMILRLARCLDVEANTLLQIAAQSEESPNIIMVDDSKVILSEGVAILEEALPNATIAGFIWPREAIEYAKMNRIAMAVLELCTSNMAPDCLSLHRPPYNYCLFEIGTIKGCHPCLSSLPPYLWTVEEIASL